MVAKVHEADEMNVSISLKKYVGVCLGVQDDVTGQYLFQLMP